MGDQHQRAPPGGLLAGAGGSGEGLPGPRLQLQRPAARDEAARRMGDVLRPHDPRAPSLRRERHLHPLQRLRLPQPEARRADQRRRVGAEDGRRLGDAEQRGDPEEQRPLAAHEHHEGAHGRGGAGAEGPLHRGPARRRHRGQPDRGSPARDPDHGGQRRLRRHLPRDPRDLAHLVLRRGHRLRDRASRRSPRPRSSRS